MNRDELHIAFKVELDKNSNSVAYGGVPAFIDAEIDYWINKGYYALLMTKFTGGTENEVKFEGDVKRISDFDRLIRTDESLKLNASENTNCASLVNLLNRQTNNRGRMFYVSSVFHWIKDGKDNCATVKLLDHTQIKNFIKTNNNIPWIDNPVGVIENNTLKIYYDPISMDADEYKLDLTYIKHPCLINNLPSDLGLSELPDQTWYEVVNRAVQLALENIESQRFSTKSQLIQMEE